MVRMLDAQALRLQIESAQGGRLAGALTPVPRQVRELFSTGIAALDQMLGGGVPLGAITELAGPASSGRTGVALSILASAMREGSMCAWVDASDALDPESAAANGVLLDQLLWVRCGVQQGPPSIQTTGSVREPGARAATSGAGTQPLARAGQHPREEERGLDRAIGELLGGTEGSRRRDRSIGTPGAPNRPLDGSPGPPRKVFRPVQRDEQISSDRQPKRRPAAAPTHAPASIQKKPAAVSPSKPARGAGSPWAPLDQALRAADLLLQAGGFRVLVLDLGSIAPEHALRIPLATWFRFRAAAEASRTVLLTIVPASCARSSAGLVVYFEALAAQCWSSRDEQTPTRSAPASQQQAGVLQFPDGHLAARAPAVESKRPALAQATMIESVRYQARMVRQRFEAPSESGSLAARRAPLATWQLRAFALREAGSS
jgi:recombination protein RecA